MPWYVVLFLIYYFVLAVVSAAITVADKTAAKKNKWRVPEATLMLIGLIGGALPMYLTMKAIRHKTQHKKFMIGLPVEMVIHTVIFAYAVYALVIR